MCAADIIIIIVILFFAIKGLICGLIKEVAGMVAVLLGLFLAVNFSGWLSNWILERGWFDPKYVEIISFTIVFLGVILLVIVLSKMLDKFVDAISLQWLNKLAGFAFGGIKGALIVAGVCYIAEQIIQNFSLTEQEFLADSRLYGQLLAIFDKLSII
ncbi:MAG: CvpA family protein [Bacteroidales bacterium]|jgi:membrane protein required for colicin V production|nr:CvpA family protein [Bacteroidales bacterium]